MKNAQRVFDQMSDKNITSWHLMIGGYISNGLGCDGLLVFQQMKQAGVPSDGETFELFFTACAQAGGGGLVSVRGGVVVGGTVVTKEVGEVMHIPIQCYSGVRPSEWSSVRIMSRCIIALVVLDLA